MAVKENGEGPHMKSFFRIKILSMILAVAVAGSCVGAGGYIIYDYESLPEEMEEARVIETSAPAEEEPEAEEAEPEEPEEEEPEEPVKELSLTWTSIEKDLKIKIQDQDSRLVTGEQFSVSVMSAAKNAKASDYKDTDKDGVIYIDKIEAGKYTVVLQEIEGYEIKNGTVTATVKDQIEYKKVDVTGEIKTESQINTAAEDTAVNNVPVESTLKDTVELLESTVTASKTAKSDVDMSNFTKASVSGGTNTAVCSRKVVQIPAEPEIPGEPKEPEGAAEPKEPDESEEPAEPGNPGDEDGSLEPAAAAAAPAAEAVPSAASAASAITETTATVSLPSSITLYNCDNASSNSYALSLGISGDSSIIKSVQWICSDPSVISLSAASGNSVTVTRKAKGSAEISAAVTYETDGAGNTAQVSVKSTVSVNDFSDTSTVLKDKAGNTLYLDSGARTAATLKDYMRQDVFYTSPKYTGWQTIDGKVYYYGADHNALTGNQVIGGVMYTFSGDGSLSQSSGNRGIDVSKYQGTIDWGAVAASGINFAIIRVGYRGSSTGVLVEDPYFKKNIAGATKAGIKVGVYFFTQAVTEAEAVEEASMAMSLVSGYKLSYPIFIDTESASNGRANGLSASARTAVVKAFCQTVKNGGYKAGVYASKSWYASQLNASSLSSYCIWVAQYNSSCTYTGKYDMWQYSSSGKVSGISGNVDMNISYTGY